jgi:hypothetical protein
MGYKGKLRSTHWQRRRPRRQHVHRRCGSVRPLPPLLRTYRQPFVFSPEWHLHLSLCFAFSFDPLFLVWAQAHWTRVHRHTDKGHSDVDSWRKASEGSRHSLALVLCRYNRFQVEAQGKNTIPLQNVHATLVAPVVLWRLAFIRLGSIIIALSSSFISCMGPVEFGSFMFGGGIGKPGWLGRK